MAVGRATMLASGALSLLTAAYAEVDRRFVNGPLDQVTTDVPGLLFHSLAIGLVSLGFVMVLYAPESRRPRRDISLEPRAAPVDPAREEAARARQENGRRSGATSPPRSHGAVEPPGDPTTQQGAPAEAPDQNELERGLRPGRAVPGEAASTTPSPSPDAQPSSRPSPADPDGLQIGRRQPPVVDPSLRGHPNTTPRDAQFSEPTETPPHDPLMDRLHELGQRADRLKVEYALGRISAGGYKELQSRIEKEQAELEAQIADRELSL